MEKNRRARTKSERRAQTQDETWIERGKKRKSPVVPFLIFTDLLP